MDDYLNEQKKKQEKKKMDYTRAYNNAKQDAEMSMMGPGMSRMDHTMVTNANDEAIPEDAADPSAQPDGIEEATPAEEGETDETADQTTDTQAASTPAPAIPVYDPKAMEDLAPAERLRINQEISRRAMAERLRMIEEMVAAEKEKDPDALEEDVRAMVMK